MKEGTTKNKVEKRERKKEYTKTGKCGIYMCTLRHIFCAVVKKRGGYKLITSFFPLSFFSLNESTQNSHSPLFFSSHLYFPSLNLGDGWSTIDIWHSSTSSSSDTGWTRGEHTLLEHSNCVHNQFHQKDESREE